MIGPIVEIFHENQQDFLKDTINKVWSSEVGGGRNFWIGLIHNGNIWKWDYSKTPMLFNGFRECYNKTSSCSSVFSDAKFGATYAYVNGAVDWQWDDQESENYKEYPICQITSSSTSSTPTMRTTTTTSATTTTGMELCKKLRLLIAIT